MEKLSGKKTYLAAGLLALLAVGVGTGKVEIDQKLFESVVAVLLAAGLAFLRSGVAKGHGELADKAAEKAAAVIEEKLANGNAKEGS